MARTQAAPVRQRYFAPLRTRQDWDEASELIARYLPIVHHIVRRYHCNFNDREDLYQEGCLVILEAERERGEAGSDHQAPQAHPVNPRFLQNGTVFPVGRVSLREWKGERALSHRISGASRRGSSPVWAGQSRPPWSAPRPWRGRSGS